jgi:hypothetical protein
MIKNLSKLQETFKSMECMLDLVAIHLRANRDFSVAFIKTPLKDIEKSPIPETAAGYFTMLSITYANKLIRAAARNKISIDDLLCLIILKDSGND